VLDGQPLAAGVEVAVASGSTIQIGGYREGGEGGLA
jgi:hypothetical protein